MEYITHIIVLLIGIFIVGILIGIRLGESLPRKNKGEDSC